MGTPDIRAQHVSIGRDVTFGAGVRIAGLNGDAESVVIGDNTTIGDGVIILAPHFSIGDYCKVHRNSLLAGHQDMRIGHNAWIGQDSVFDSTGTLHAGDNLCVGAHSSLWSHMKYGDVTEGCRFARAKPLIIGKDVWIGDSCVVTPTVVRDKIMVLANSVVTKTHGTNRIYAGVPARDVTVKMGGPPFNPITVHLKLLRLTSLAYGFTKDTGIANDSLVFVGGEDEIGTDPAVTYFAADTRVYTKRSTHAEVEFLKWCMPNQAKFTPLDDPLRVKTVVEITDGENVVGKRRIVADSIL